MFDLVSLNLCSGIVFQQSCKRHTEDCWIYYFRYYKLGLYLTLIQNHLTKYFAMP